MPEEPDCASMFFEHDLVSKNITMLYRDLGLIHFSSLAFRPQTLIAIDTQEDGQKHDQDSKDAQH